VFEVGHVDASCPHARPSESPATRRRGPLDRDGRVCRPRRPPSRVLTHKHDPLSDRPNPILAAPHLPRHETTTVTTAFQPPTRSHPAPTGTAIGTKLPNCHRPDTPPLVAAPPLAYASDRTTDAIGRDSCETPTRPASPGPPTILRRNQPTGLPPLAGRPPAAS